MRLIHIYLIATATDLLYCLIIDLFYRATPLFGGHSEEAPPVPFPNTEVKLFSADGTAWATVWESRSPPNSLLQTPLTFYQVWGVWRLGDCLSEPGMAGSFQQLGGFPGAW